MSTLKKYQLILVILVLILVVTVCYQNLSRPKLEYLRFDQILETQNGILSEILPRSNSFFLVETSGRIELTLKELCVLESVAKYHRENQVYLLSTSPIFKDETLQTLQKKYSNLQVKYLYIPSLISGTPLEDLNWIDVIERSKYSVSHLSDLIRYFILYNFGGTYLDLDALIIQTFPNLTNFLGRESFTVDFLAAGVLRFQKNHPILMHFLQHLKHNFNGQDWSANGPKLVTKVMQELCHTQDLAQMSPDKCLGVHVFEPYAFYPVPWRHWQDLHKTDFHYDLNHSYSVHLWGRHSSEVKLEDLPKNAALFQLAKTHCPVLLGI